MIEWIRGSTGQQLGSRRIARFVAKRTAGEDDFERVDGLTSLGVERLGECFVGTADVVTSREVMRQMIKNGDDIEDLKVEPDLEAQVCQKWRRRETENSHYHLQCGQVARCANAAAATIES